MRSRDFVFWLQGMFELGNPTTLDARQVDLIKTHLALVFKHDPDIDTEACKHPPSHVVPSVFPVKPEPYFKHDGISGKVADSVLIC